MIPEAPAGWQERAESAPVDFFGDHDSMAADVRSKISAGVKVRGLQVSCVLGPAKVKHTEICMV